MLLTMKSGFFDIGSVRKYSYFAGGGNFAVLRQKFPVALVTLWRFLLQ